jgi:hypothetical protein
VCARGGGPPAPPPLDSLCGYYIWDCAAGTGNLLEGLPNADGVFASTIDKTDVAVMHDRITNGNLNLWLPNVFQFDFLNDSLCDPKVPQALRNILQDPHKCRKLIIYINPPYAQAGNKRIMSNREEKTKRGVATQNMVYTKYKSVIGKAATELYALFFTRIKAELPKVILAQFSSMTLITGHNFAMFREFFKAKHLGGFVIHANSFDNVEGDFPIGFNIWDLNHDDSIQRITCDTYSTQEKYLGSKTFCAASSKILTHWISEHKDNDGAAIGALSTGRNDFAHQNIVWIENDKRTTTSCMMITAQNLNYVCIFYAVRHVIPHTWLNHNDQFLAPSAAWKQDAQFCNDCLVYTLFHDKNRIRSAGLCHWIPFTEAELGLHSPLCSRFMSNFLSGRIFSSQAKSTLAAGMALWRYYIEQPSVNINASWYDIREYFQGRSRSGRMNPMSNDVAYTKLMALLKESMHILAQTIENKVYKYEFLRT